jgi:hypothetical protein
LNLPNEPADPLRIPGPNYGNGIWPGTKELGFTAYFGKPDGSNFTDTLVFDNIVSEMQRILKSHGIVLKSQGIEPNFLFRRNVQESTFQDIVAITIYVPLEQRAQLEFAIREIERIGTSLSPDQKREAYERTHTPTGDKAPDAAPAKPAGVQKER